MGHNTLAERFELDDLQLLDGPPMRGAKTVVHTVVDVLGVTASAFVAFDEVAMEGVIRESAGCLPFGTNYPLHGSTAMMVRNTAGLVKRNALPRGQAEHDALGAGSVLAAPVLAPDGRPAGMLAAFDRDPRIWTRHDTTRIEDFAHLISQEVILRASFATLSILARERLHTVS